MESKILKLDNVDNSLKVSVIIPVYKVEEYLDRCLTSVVNQTYTNLEIILVDDGSPDNSGALCDEWAKKDSRIRVIHKENGGQSSARNIAIKESTGKLLSFIDSDDFIDENMIKVLVKMHLESNCKMCCCSYFRYFDANREKAEKQDISGVSYITCEFKNTYLIDNMLGIDNSPCNKLYDRSLFNEISFPEGMIYEDLYIMANLMYEANELAITEYKGYYYCINMQSTTRDISPKKRYALTVGLKRRENFFTEKGLTELKRKLQATILLNSYYQYYFARSKKDKEYTKITILDIKEYRKKCKNNPYLTRACKGCNLLYSISKTAFYLLCKLRYKNR
jgi:glycosyltransferase involved in cell wall biosynthesis